MNKMMLSLNCLILGQASEKSFTENIGETYKNDSDTGEMNLWKVDNKKVEEEENNLKEFTKSDIIEKLGGKEMVARFPLKRYFDVNQEMDIEEVSLAWNDVKEIYNKSLTYYWFLGPNWNDASSIYKWIQQFTLNRGRDLLVNTYGKDFKFLQRDDTIDALWNAGGPGVGKSRFLDEVERLLVQYANKSDDDEIRDAFTNMTVINTTYDNGCPARDIDVTIGAEASLAIRILFDFTLNTAIQVVYADVIIQKNQEIESNPLLVLVLGIDELNQLHDNNPEAFRTLIKAIGGVMCKSPANIYFIPILAGTIEGPLDQYISGSIQRLLPLPLRLLEDDDAIEIGKAMGLVDNQYVRCHPYFRINIGDVGGHVKTLEYFYQSFKNELNKLNGDYNKIKMASIMNDVKFTVNQKY
ncbi:hypothetical protein C1646_752992 [Rhizophagus diaphanus]|nr:hypothetical protein C1646_752992 [Rhizophagus diaphanus] [Rhizophagus sp. MUCL 43196]